MTIWPERVRYKFRRLGRDSNPVLVHGSVWIIACKTCFYQLVKAFYFGSLGNIFPETSFQKSTLH